MISRFISDDNRVIHQSAARGGGTENKDERRGEGNEDCRTCIYIAGLAHTITECADVKTKRFHDKLKWIYVEILSAPRRALSHGQRTSSSRSEDNALASARFRPPRRRGSGETRKGKRRVESSTRLMGSKCFRPSTSTGPSLSVHFGPIRIRPVPIYFKCRQIFRIILSFLNRHPSRRSSAAHCAFKYEIIFGLRARPLPVSASALQEPPNTATPLNYY